MATLTVNPKKPKPVANPVELAWLRRMAVSRGCDAMMLHLAPAPGAIVSVHWEDLADD